MTELAYLASMPAAYERTFSATVAALPPGAVVLDRTFFYAAGGGQPGDRGTLVGAGGPPIPIADVAKSGGSVLHRIGRGAPKVGWLKVGGTVQGEIDWTRRHRHMRLHTAQHLLSALLFERMGLRTRKAILNGLVGSIELEAPAVDPAGWASVLSELADAVERPRDVRVAFVDRAGWDAAPAARSGLVPLDPAVDPVRVIEIDGIDRCPCGGTHVRSTGEIGPVEVPPADGARITLRLREAAPPTPGG